MELHCKASALRILLVVVLIFNSGYINAQNGSNDFQQQEKIDSIIQLLTPEEKVALCHGHALFSSAGVERLGLPEINMLDGPHGIRPELKRHSWDHAGWTTDSVTAFPALTCLAATFNRDLAFEYGLALGEEARFRKKDVLLGPGVNIYRTPLNGRNFEYMGEDPFLASQMVVPYVKGVQENGVAACVKHFAVNNQEHGRASINVEVGDRALHEIYLPAFKAAVQKGAVWSLMGAYNKFRGQHCCHNDFLLNQILKDDWGFDGAVISDWGGTHSTREAALNGLDIEMGSNAGYEDYYLANDFLELVKNGEISTTVIDDKARRILRLMLRTTLNPERKSGIVNSAGHSQTAYKVAAEGIVLLKNEDDFFPLDPDKTHTIAVIGDNAIRSMTVGGGSSEIKAKYEISPLEGLKKRFANSTVNYVPGYSSGDMARKNKVLSQSAIEAVSKADVVLFIGGLNKMISQDCEGHDRKQLELPYDQNELINKLSKVNENIAVLLLSGNAVALPWLPKVKTVVQSWYLVSEVGNAIADVVCGVMNPSGKLPFTFPVKLEDNSAHRAGSESYPGDGTTVHYAEVILVGYRWHESKQIAPLFAFGHGLSYTRFEVDNFSTNETEYSTVDEIVITCDLKNVGAFSGSEVIQVYVGKLNSKVERAQKELKGFSKKFLKPGEVSTVEIKIDVQDLAFYNEKKEGWEVESGRYRIFIGNASNRIFSEFVISIH